jgi:hypothetical protein
MLKNYRNLGDSIAYTPIKLLYKYVIEFKSC